MITSGPGSRSFIRQVWILFWVIFLWIRSQAVHSDLSLVFCAVHRRRFRIRYLLLTLWFFDFLHPQFTIYYVIIFIASFTFYHANFFINTIDYVIDSIKTKLVYTRKISIERLEWLILLMKSPFISGVSNRIIL